MQLSDAPAELPLGQKAPKSGRQSGERANCGELKSRNFHGETGSRESERVVQLARHCSCFQTLTPRSHSKPTWLPTIFFVQLHRPIDLTREREREREGEGEMSSLSLCVS